MPKHPAKRIKRKKKKGARPAVRLRVASVGLQFAAPALDIAHTNSNVTTLHFKAQTHMRIHHQHFTQSGRTVIRNLP